VTAPAAASIEADLARRLRRARRIAVLGIGDELRREDRLGMLAAREVEALRLPDVRVFLAGVVPESFTGPIRRVRPDHVLLLDAAEFGARPGTARVLHPAEVGGSRFSTHAIPLPVVIAYIEETQEGRKIRLVHSDHRPLQDVATGSVTPSGVLSWSPDGMRLAFADEDGDLYIVDIASGITTPVLAMPGRIEGTTWSGNGTTVVFSATREENATQYLWDIYSIDLDDGELRRITTSGKDRGPDLCRMVPP